MLVVSVKMSHTFQICPIGFALHMIYKAKMIILWVNIWVRSPPSLNSVLGTTWSRFSNRPWFRTRVRNPVGPQPGMGLSLNLNLWSSEQNPTWVSRPRGVAGWARLWLGESSLKGVDWWTVHNVWFEVVPLWDTRSETYFRQDLFPAYLFFRR